MDLLTDWIKSLNSEILLKVKCIFLAEFFVNKAKNLWKCFLKKATFQFA